MTRRRPITHRLIEILIAALLGLLFAMTIGQLALDAWDAECDQREAAAREITSQGAFK